MNNHASHTNIDNSGGTFVAGNVHTAGDFVGRDKIVHIANQVVQQATTAAEEARQAQDLARQRLAEGVRVYAGELAAVAADNKDTAAGPYKGLLAYTLADAELFFGRDQAIGSLLAQMERHRLTILQSESGAGKSSLLRAGIAPRLLTAGHLPVILRPYNRPPDLVVKQTFLPDLAQTPELETAPLRAFLRPVTEVLGPRATLVLVLDQFEEFFTLLPDERVRALFVEELADCVEDESLRVRWVLALRSEFFGDLATFRPRIRNPFQNDFRLNRLTRNEARDVIVKPAEPYGITYEPALVDRLLDDLSEEGQIHPPQVQLVCDALYQKLTERQPAASNDIRVITEAMYEAEGEAAGILRGHLNQVLRRSLPRREERDLARRLLVELVSSDQRRIRRTRSELAATLVAAGSLDEVLRELVENRLLNVEKDEEHNDSSYEIAHDYLLDEIEIDPVIRKQKEIEELLEQAVQQHHRNNRILDARTLTDVQSYIGSIVLDKDVRQLLFTSVVAVADELPEWPNYLFQVDYDETEKLRTQYLESQEIEERLRGIDILKHEARYRDDCKEQLKQVLINDPSSDVCAYAAEAFVDQRLLPWLFASLEASRLDITQESRLIRAFGHVRNIPDLSRELEEQMLYLTGGPSRDYYDEEIQRVSVKKRAKAYNRRIVLSSTWQLIVSHGIEFAAVLAFVFLFSEVGLQVSNILADLFTYWFDLEAITVPYGPTPVIITSLFGFYLILRYQTELEHTHEEELLARRQINELECLVFGLLAALVNCSILLLQSMATLAVGEATFPDLLPGLHKQVVTIVIVTSAVAQLFSKSFAHPERSSARNIVTLVRSSHRIRKILVVSALAAAFASIWNLSKISSEGVHIVTLIGWFFAGFFMTTAGLLGLYYSLRLVYDGETFETIIYEMRSGLR